MTKCWVLMYGDGYYRDSDAKLIPFRVFLDGALAKQEFNKLEEIMDQFAEHRIGGMPHKERMELLKNAEVEAPKRYAELGYEANTHSWWELIEDVTLVDKDDK